jgi:hypothetical protein
MTDPDVVADRAMLVAPLLEEVGGVGAESVLIAPIRKVMLGDALHRMVAGVDPHHRGDRAEAADRRVTILLANDPYG